jgi:phage replication initiation protein
MKKIPLAPPRDLGLMPESEHDQIYQAVLHSIDEARQRKAAESALRDATSASEAGSAARAPATNRGGKSEIAARLVLEDGEVMEVPARRGWGGDHAFLDWVNFTTDETDFFFGMSLISDEEVIDRVSFYCKEIFGFGISQERATGANFYQRSYVLGENCGMVCHGGQRSTVLVMLSGEGCAAAREGWEKRLYDFLTKCGPRAKLTRLDLAHDIYDGVAYSVDQADADFDAGLFNCGGRHPNHEQRGNWKRPTGKGRTLYIGSRENGKFCRVYEKGRQLGDKTSPWVRVEVEMKSVSRIIPFDALLRPGEYLAASYPAFAWLSERQERVLTTQKKTEITYDAMCDWAKRQMGAFVNVLVEIEGSAEKAVAKIIKEGAIPSRLKVPSWLFVDAAIHEQPREKPNEEMFFQAAFA